MLEFLVQQADMSPAGRLRHVQHGLRVRGLLRRRVGEETVRLATGLGLSAVWRVSSRKARRVLLEPVDVVFESGDMDLTPRVASYSADPSERKTDGQIQNR